MADNEHDYDLFWHALNYRTAAPQHADQCWLELQACVERLIERDRKLWSDDGVDAEMGEK